MSAVVPFFTCWSMARNVAAFCGAILLVSAASAPSQSSADRLPSRVEEYVAAHVKLTPQERKTLGEGNPVTKLLGTDESEEVAVFGAIWIGAPIRRYVDAVTDIENFERGGGFTVTKRISSPPRLEDFAQLRLSADDVQDLRSCRVGDCEVKFGEEALERLQKNVNWGSAKARDEANAIVQQLALGYVTSYLEGGNERLAVYRDQSRPTFVAQEFRLMVDKMPELTVYMPEVRRYLLEYPKVTMPGFRSFLYLAGDRVRSQANHPYQSHRGARRLGRRRRGVQDAVRKPLLLDRARAPSASSRFEARSGLLVHHRQPQSIGRAQRIRRFPCPDGRQRQGRRGTVGGAAQDEAGDGGRTLIASMDCSSSERASDGQIRPPAAVEAPRTGDNDWPDQCVHHEPRAAI